MRIIPGINVAVIEGDTTHAKWIEELGTIHHDPWMAEQVCRHIKPGDVVVQGGANIGTLTRAMLDAGAHVIAFEPNTDAYECLIHNCPGAHTCPAGLSDQPSFFRLHKEQNAGASYLAEVATPPPFGAPFDGKVPCIVLDDLRGLDEKDVRQLVLDVEGFEGRALRGARRTIARCHPIIICEVNRGALERAGTSDDELFALIESYGYRWEILQPECKRGDAQYDIFCLPK